MIVAATAPLAVNERARQAASEMHVATTNPKIRRCITEHCLEGGYP